MLTHNRTPQSVTRGPIDEMVIDFLNAMIGLRLADGYYGRPLREAIIDGVRWEFGPDAKVEFPDPCSVILTVAGKSFTITP